MVRWTAALLIVGMGLELGVSNVEVFEIFSGIEILSR